MRHATLPSLLCTGMLVLVSPHARAERLDLVVAGDTWRYFKGLEDSPANWAAPDFADGAWLQGASGFGYGDEDDVTVLDDMEDEYKTVYARRAFEIADPAAIRRLFLKISYDDGFIAYVNGVEAARRGLGAALSAVDRDTSATSHEYGVLEEIDLAASIGSLVAGRNVLAIEVHNSSLGSDDLSLSPALQAYDAGPALTRGPFLQQVTTSSALVVWGVDPPGTGAVEFGPNDAFGSVAQSPQVRALHEVPLTGLAPGTEYAYRLLFDGAPCSPVFRFRTAPDGAQRPLRMVVAGDTEKLNLGFLGAVRQAAAIAPDLLMIPGDVIRDGDAEGYVFDQWRHVISRCMLFAVPGNHDVENEGVAYLDAFYFPSAGSGSEWYYSFDWGNAHIVCLDVMGRSYATGSAQYNWLRADLGATNKPWKLVFLHAAPYSTGTTHGSTTDIRTSLCPVFDQYKVDLVFSGHNHNFERTFPIRGNAVVDGSARTSYTDPAGTIYVVTGGAGGALYAQSTTVDKKYSACFFLKNHVSRVDLDGGTCTVTAIDPEGTTFYTLRVAKTLASAPPVIGDVRAVDVGETSAFLEWTTDTPADSRVEFGLPGAFDHVASDPAYVTAHRVTLAPLSRGESYEARAASSNAVGTTTSSPVTFRTERFFVRGDANDDGRLDLSDAIQILRVLFAGGTAACRDAADANDSGTLDVSDAVTVLGYLFARGAPLRAPFPAPGPDPTTDGLACGA